MDVSRIIIWIIAGFMAVGIADHLLLGDRLGYGTQFKEGLMTMGSLALSMLGIMCLAPLLGKLLLTISGPLYHLLGLDSAMAAGMILPLDMGGYALATEMTDNAFIRQLSGIYLSSMMGSTIVFSVPMALGIIDDGDQVHVAKGFLAGFTAIPFGVLLSAKTAGIPFLFALVNLVPTICIALLLAAGLSCIPNLMLKGFHLFSTLIQWIVWLSLGAAILEKLLGIQLIAGMEPIDPQIKIVGAIALTLTGAYPMIYFIRTFFEKPLQQFGERIGIDGNAVIGMIACLANNIPMFSMIRDMDGRGKIMAVAFSVCASFSLGDYLGFISTLDEKSIVPMVAGKVGGGILAVIFAKYLTKREILTAEQREDIPDCRE